jgi:hypothetical protein
VNNKKLDKKNSILIFFFIVTVILNYFYGPIIYSKILGKEEAYTIGKLCEVSRADCENIYFKVYLDKIDSLSNQSRSFFSNIFIQEDQIGYVGNCPCPYNYDSRGGICGGRSSYSKNGKISYCYDSDVSDNQITQKKASMIAQVQKNLDDAVNYTLSVYNEKYTLFLIIFFYGILLFYFRDKKTSK